MLFCLSTTVSAAYQPLVFDNFYIKDEYNAQYSAREINLGIEKYISADDALKSAGYELGWDSIKRAIIVYDPATAQYMYIYIYEGKVWNGIKSIYYDNAVVIKNDAAYISEEMLNDVIMSRYLLDRYPVAENTSNEYDQNTFLGNISCYNGIYLLDGRFAFEMISITDEGAMDYADAVNAVAAALPEHVNVHNMLIPNSASFYAPEDFAGNALSQYEKIYQNLSPRVTPVNIYPTLLSHSKESIYFNTDHHWTHRGAYYAYEKFMSQKGKTVNYINYFPQRNMENIVGSFAGLMKGTAGETLISAHGETLERFIPPYTIQKDVYLDCALKKYEGTGPMINDNIRTYSTFLGGDVPVTKLHNKNLRDGSTLCIIKDSYANAFSIWAACDYEYVYLVDIRCFNGANGFTEEFNINDFYNVTGFDDLLIMSYPNTVADRVLRHYIRSFS